MKISKLFLKNIYGIKEQTLNPGDITIFEGSNEVGKTSFLDSIKTLFTNQGVRTRVIHNGETEAELLAELDDGTVIDRKKRTEKSDSIKITQGKDTVSSPEGYLKSLFSGNQFNPIKDFIEAGSNPTERGKIQKKILLSLCKINFTENDYIKNFGELPQDYDADRHILENLEAIQAKTGFYYLEREKLNRERRAKENVRDEILESMPKNYDAEQWRDVILADLYNKVTDAQKLNEDVAKTKAYIDGAESKRQAINNKYDLQVKDTEDLKDFKIEKAKKAIEQQKQAISDEISGINIKVSQHEEEIKKLLQQIENEKKIITELQHEIRLKEKDLQNFDQSILMTKTESIVNEFNIAVKGIEENRKNELDMFESRLKDAEEYLSNHSEVEIEPLKQEAEHAEAMKNFLREADRVETINGDILDIKTRSDEFTRKIELARALPGQLLQTAEMPIKNIKLEDSELLIMDANGNYLSLDNLSEGRQMEIALEVAKAKAGDLKVILIDGFEKLSKHRRESFLEKAKATGLQYFITRVTDDESLNIIEL